MSIDEPTLGEIGRGVNDLKAEIRLLRGELVRSDVYDAHRRTDDLRIQAVDARIKAVETELDGIQQNGAAMRRLVYAALLAAVGSAAVQAITALVATKS